MWFGFWTLNKIVLKMPFVHFHLRPDKMSNQEVWTYLVNTPNPWDADNQKLLDIYRSVPDTIAFHRNHYIN